MRIRTLAALLTGTALGASGVWLLDPESGPERRRDALRAAWDRGRAVDWQQVGSRAGVVAQDLGRRAADGYRDGVSAG